MTNDAHGAGTNRPEPDLSATDFEGMDDFLDSALKDAHGYFDAQKEYLALDIQEKAGRAAGSLFTVVVASISALLFILFASVALAWWLGELWGRMGLGFIAVGGLYLLVFVVVHFVAREAIRDRLTLGVINSFRDEKD